MITAVVTSANQSSCGGARWLSSQPAAITSATATMRIAVSSSISVRGCAPRCRLITPIMLLSRTPSGTRAEPARGATWATYRLS